MSRKWREALGVKKSPSSKHEEKEEKKTEVTKIKKLRDEERIYSQREGFLSYDSKGKPDNFNCKAKRSDGSEIVCRHLSYRVALTGIKNYQNQVSSIEKIEENLKENIFDEQRIAFQSVYYNLCSFKGFGRQLKGIAEEIRQGEECSLLLNSENHLMAITLSHKLKAEKEYYVIKFYDPNKTGRHKRIVLKDINAIEKLKITNLLTDNAVSMYFPRHKLIGLISSH